jgi:hypothetical protein
MCLAPQNSCTLYIPVERHNTIQPTIILNLLFLQDELDKVSVSYCNFFLFYILGYIFHANMESNMSMMNSISTRNQVGPDKG